MLAALPQLERTCEALGRLAIPVTLEHGDLHANNILVEDENIWLFDWADASVSHPFASLLVTFDSLFGDLESDDVRRGAPRLIDAYLETWTELVEPVLLRAALGPALWLAHATRALDWQHMLAGATSDDNEEWRSEIAQWLRRWLARRAWAHTVDWPTVPAADATQ